jgi:hypothetical protein
MTIFEYYAAWTASRRIGFYRLLSVAIFIVRGPNRTIARRDIAIAIRACRDQYSCRDKCDDKHHELHSGNVASYFQEKSWAIRNRLNAVQDEPELELSC